VTRVALILFLLARPGWATDGVSLSGLGWSLRMGREDHCMILERDGHEFKLTVVDEKGRDIRGLASWEPWAEGTSSVSGAWIRFEGQEGEIEGRFSIRDKGQILIEPGKGFACIRVDVPVEIGLLPCRTLEEVFYLPEDVEDNTWIHVPSENWFVSLLKGRQGMLVWTWPEGRQSLSLRSRQGDDRSLFCETRLMLDGRPCCLGLLAAEQIWHREDMAGSSLERDRPIAWSRPFDARWQTQLPIHAESVSPRTFKFFPSRRSPWRPEIGNYVWPVWFQDDQTYVHVSKRIPPDKDLVIYPAEDHERSLLGFARTTPWSELYTEKGRRHEIPPGERNAPNVGFNACWGTFFLRRSVYTQGLQHRYKAYLAEHADYLADRVYMVQARNEMYEAFLKQMRRDLETWLVQAEEDSGKREYLFAMLRHLEETEEGHARKMVLFGGTTSREHKEMASRCLFRLKELLEEEGPEVYPECEYLIDRFNRLSWGHDESTGMRFNMNTRAWSISAALDAANTPQAMDLAREIRSRIRETLKAGTHW